MSASLVGSEMCIRDRFDLHPMFKIQVKDPIQYWTALAKSFANMRKLLKGDLRKSAGKALQALE
eukprot:3180415-Alexandrium_andersonii.AAC.1